MKEKNLKGRKFLPEDWKKEIDSFLRIKFKDRASIKDTKFGRRLVFSDIENNSIEPLVDFYLSEIQRIFSFGQIIDRKIVQRFLTNAIKDISRDLYFLEAKRAVVDFLKEIEEKERNDLAKLAIGENNLFGYLTEAERKILINSWLVKVRSDLFSDLSEEQKTNFLLDSLTAAEKDEILTEVETNKWESISFESLMEFEREELLLERIINVIGAEALNNVDMEYAILLGINEFKIAKKKHKI